MNEKPRVVDKIKHLEFDEYTLVYWELKCKQEVHLSGCIHFYGSGVYSTFLAQMNNSPVKKWQKSKVRLKQFPSYDSAQPS